MNKAFKKPKPHYTVKKMALLNTIKSLYGCATCKDNRAHCYCLAA